MQLPLNLPAKPGHALAPLVFSSWSDNGPAMDQTSLPSSLPVSEGENWASCQHDAGSQFHVNQEFSSFLFFLSIAIYHVMLVSDV